jgi:hypothetical protein
MEYVQLRYKTPDDPENAPISSTKVPVIYCQIRSLQQLLDKKNSLSSDTSHVNILTGQVTGDSKATTISNMETMSLVATNQLTTLKEFLGPRSDDNESKQKMLEMIYNDGDYDIADLNIKSHNKRSFETSRIMLTGAGYLVNYGKNAKSSYILPKE